ncbi:unnamed protein product [Diatraea saccharalis]|uniref:Uncharacterized protein n=1 Tax=Diatraea saccharalis TaxID=40085 RepID=A0A9N9RAJ6_9NEOP|nr:unnamed protein product [Diatraea saccharalis]
MPAFDYEYEYWLEFHDTFLSLVHNSTEISKNSEFPISKIINKGSAELVIDSLQFSAANYSAEWELFFFIYLSWKTNSCKKNINYKHNKQKANYRFPYIDIA